jgi:F-type H+-transporting ATPase subunit epsilon
MRLEMAVPERMLVEREIRSLQAEDPTGRFGLRPGHARHLTALVPGLVVWRYVEDGRPGETFAAVRGGVLETDGRTVRIAAREAHISEDVDELEAMIGRAEQERAEREYVSYRSLYQMQVGAWRRLLESGDVT